MILCYIFNVCGKVSCCCGFCARKLDTHFFVLLFACWQQEISWSMVALDLNQWYFQSFPPPFLFHFSPPSLPFSAAYAFYEVHILLELFLALSAYSEAIYLLFMLFFLHCVYCDFWLGVWVEIFGFRFTLLHQILHNTCLTLGFASIFRFHRWSPRCLPQFTHRSIAYTHLGVGLPFWCLVATLLPPTFPWPQFSVVLGGLYNPYWREAFQRQALSLAAPNPPHSTSSLLLFYALLFTLLRLLFSFIETIVFEIMLVYLFSDVIFPDSNNVFTVPAIFWWFFWNHLVRPFERTELFICLISYIL